MGHLPALPDIARGFGHLADEAVTGFGRGLAEKFVDAVVDVLQRRGIAVYGTRTAIERLHDLGKRLTNRMAEVEDRLSALASDVIAAREDDPSFRAAMVEAIEIGAESSDGDAREVLADLVVQRLLTDDAVEAGRQRRAIGAIRNLDGRYLRLLGAMGALLHPEEFVKWPPFAAAIASKDPGGFEMALRELLARLVPDDPTSEQLAAFVELGLAEREPNYEPYGLPSYADAIEGLLQRFGFPTVPPMQSALDNFQATARASQLLMPRPDGGALVRDDGRGLAGYRLLPVGQLIAEVVVDRLLVAPSGM